MYPILIQQGATGATARVPIWLVDASDGITAETGITGTCYVSKNGATPAATTNSVTQVSAANMPGLYYIELTGTETNTLGTVYLSKKTAATAQWHGCAHIVDFDPFDSVRLGLTALPNATPGANGGLPTVDATNYVAGIQGTKNQLDDLNDVSTAQVNAEVLDVHNTDTLTELSAAPSGTPTLRQAVMFLFMALRNKMDVTSSLLEVHNDAGTVIAKATLSDAAGTFSRAEFVDGP